MHIGGKWMTSARLESTHDRLVMSMLPAAREWIDMPALRADVGALSNPFFLFGERWLKNRWKSSER